MKRMLSLLFRGVMGAFLGGFFAFIAMARFSVHWWVVAIAAGLGFLMGAVFGDDALDFLKSRALWW
jgi:hypothetical protein